MIHLTKLNGDEFLLHAAQIESIESNPDTRIELINGKQLYVREAPAEVTARMRDWYRSLTGRGDA